MSTFERYFNKSEGELTESNKALVLKKVTRGFESTIDQLEEEKMNLTERLEANRIKVANGETARIIDIGDMLIDLAELKVLMDALVTEQEVFVGK